MLTADQASAVANALTADAQSKSSKRALARLRWRAGEPPPGMSAAQFRKLVDEAERHVATSWKLLCPLGAAILILVALFYGHAYPLMVGFPPCAFLILNSLRRKLVWSYIRKAADAHA
jgi:hypothetical protein